MSLNPHEEIVEIVGNPSRQGAYRLHFLGLQILDFQSLFLGDVSYEIEGRRFSLPNDADGIDFCPQIFPCLILCPERVGAGQILPTQSLLMVFNDHRAVIGVDVMDKGGHRQLRRRIPEKLFRLEVGEFDDAVLSDENGVIGVLDKKAIFFFRGLKLSFRAPAFRDIAEAPDPSPNFFPDPLRFRIAFEDPSVLEFQDVIAFEFRLAVQSLYFVHKDFRILKLIQNVLQQLAVVARGGQGVRDSPEGEKLRVVRGDFSLPVHHQNSICGGIESRLQKRKGFFKGFLRLLARRDVDEGLNQTILAAQFHPRPPI